MPLHHRSAEGNVFATSFGSNLDLEPLSKYKLPEKSTNPRCIKDFIGAFTGWRMKSEGLQQK
ncbi:MAG: hypothetical protein B0D91_15250 [Oceanospirillales bacterium LUC14_002_19_P2]|nr:MAG: hypothetical protein B0D91_15250 [Oceanospirillales bacterium LUC14_002_19_P2]